MQLLIVNTQAFPPLGCILRKCLSSMIKEVFKWGVNIAQEAVYISVGWRSVPSRLRREVKPVKAYDQAWRTWWQIW